jgi:ubiquinone/menaquinone biosynthesis C-methylase UbiE
MKSGDFSKLASDYKKYRPSYNLGVVQAIVRTLDKRADKINVADVGAGTGIFTNCLIECGVKKLIAVEPNDAMRQVGQDELQGSVEFVDGSAEKTGLQRGKYDLITMASSFHWPNTDNALEEFNILLNPQGVFAAVWNPRVTKLSECETRVQNLLSEKYGLQSRISSGLSGITENLREILTKSGYFKSVIYVDALDVVQRSHEQYLGAWRSVNDIQSQLGEKSFKEFLADVEHIITDYQKVKVAYLTRAWIAKK